MKYLKPFNESTTQRATIDGIPGLPDDIDDIFMEMRDVGYFIKIKENSVPGVPFLFLYEIVIKQKSPFPFYEIIDVVDRLQDMLDVNLYKSPKSFSYTSGAAKSHTNTQIYCKIGLSPRSLIYKNSPLGNGLLILWDELKNNIRDFESDLDDGSTETAGVKPPNNYVTHVVDIRLSFNIDYRINILNGDV